MQTKNLTNESSILNQYMNSTPVLLWENANVSDTFASCEISIPTLSKYKFIYILFNQYTTSTTKCSTITPTKIQAQDNSISILSSSSKVYTRSLRIWEAKISFGTGYVSGDGTNNNVNIPVSIYGIN